jgi:serine O-acetyltransferase
MIDIKAETENEMGLFDLIRSDLGRFRQTFSLRNAPYSHNRVVWESIFFKSGFRAVLLYRLSHWFYIKGHTYIAWWLTRQNVRSTGVEIEFNAIIGPGLLITHPVGIVIGRGTVIGPNATLFQGVSFGVKSWHPNSIRKFPRVGSNCFFFANAAVIGDIAIGDYCVIGTNTVVDQNMPNGAMAVGSPAVILRDKGREHILVWQGIADSFTHKESKR